MTEGLRNHITSMYSYIVVSVACHPALIMNILIKLNVREFDYLVTEMLVNLQFLIDEGRGMISALTSRTIYESVFRSSMENLSWIYYHLLIAPRENMFYAPLMINHLRNLKAHIYTWNRSHLLAGSVGFIIGGWCTYLSSRFIFPRTRYLTQMRAVIARSGKGLHGVGFVEQVPLPLFVGPDDVLIHVKAAALDSIDIEVAFGQGRIVFGKFRTIVKTKDCYSIILGRDCVGTVVDSGCNVTRFELSDEVWAAVPYWLRGTMADYVSINECYVSHKPMRLDFFEAASLPFSGCIALDCVRRRAGIVDMKSGKGKRVLVHSGNTATGSIIIQLCAMCNVSITTSCSSRAVNKMIDAGAQSILLLDQISFDVASSRRYDIVFNTIGESAKSFCENRVIDGGLVIDASALNYVPKDASNFLYSTLYAVWLKILQGVGLNPWRDVSINAGILDELSELVTEGKLYPVSDSVFNVENCERAFRFLQADKVVGKPIIYFNVPKGNEFYI